MSIFTIIGIVVLLSIITILIQRLLLSPLRHVPGPKIYAVSTWPICYDDLKGRTTRKIYDLHLQYGPVVRVGPAHIAFNSLTALKTIYGAGSRSQRTAFYKLFEPYGRPTMFTMPSVEDHRNRKQLLARPYAKTHITGDFMAQVIESKASQFLNMIDTKVRDDCDMGLPLSFYALDVATAFIYGSRLGTTTLQGSSDQSILKDYEAANRRELSWMAVHGSRNFKANLLSTLGGVNMKSIQVAKPFERIRSFALEAFRKYQAEGDENESSSADSSLVSQLMDHRQKSEKSDLADVDIVSECADHLLAGIETTKNLLLFVFWVLSLPENWGCQDKLRAELNDYGPSILNNQGLPKVEAVDKLPYLSAVVKEALRLHAPLPSSQPRVFDVDMMIDDYLIPANTVVSMSPYCMHHNPDVFSVPYSFNPKRWLPADPEDNEEQNKWWWPFSSGGRMCTGMQ